ncbi:MAG: RNA-binding protein [Nitrosomonas sp.]|nr:RNA-binding protein [Nitrosomonas sp.]
MQSGTSSDSLVLSNIHKDVTDEELCGLFSKYGVLKNSKIRFEKGTAYGKGIGFVHYQDPKCTEAAYAALNNYELKGQPLKIIFFKPK